MPRPREGEETPPPRFEHPHKRFKALHGIQIKAVAFVALATVNCEETNDWKNTTLIKDLHAGFVTPAPSGNEEEISSLDIDRIEVEQLKSQHAMPSADDLFETDDSDLVTSATLTEEEIVSSIEHQDPGARQTPLTTRRGG
ncbi:hypothetical protein PoB_002728400 [Plakobranchus ocellatus]|uniref:Uncharacterized protein n=1 Tax=Plakobranchus ocellatus TaxID=259542 RepID=A0AAV4A3K2_9GAST|nr:hypothetical protein PoB_002728400 [Plakobranchus ocellatus]